MGADRAELGGAGTGLGSLARAARLQGLGTAGRADRSGRGCQNLIWGTEGSPHQAGSPAQASVPLPGFVCPQSTHAFAIPTVPTVTVRSQLVENPPFLPSLRDTWELFLSPFCRTSFRSHRASQPDPNCASSMLHSVPPRLSPPQAPVGRALLL